MYGFTCRCNAVLDGLAGKKNEDLNQMYDNEAANLSVTRSAWRYNRSNYSTVVGLALYRPTYTQAQNF